MIYGYYCIHQENYFKSSYSSKDAQHVDGLLLQKGGVKRKLNSLTIDVVYYLSNLEPI